MDIELSNRTKNIKPSPTLAINAKAKQLKASGGDIISLSVGEPDFDTPDHIKQAAIQAIQAGFTKYTAVDGTPDLKQAIVNKFARDNNLEYSSKEVIVSSGAKQSIYNMLQALINPGDEVIIPAPYWVSYPDMAILCDGKPIIVTTKFDQQYKLTPKQLENSITDRTRLLILNSPSNPTGMMYTKEELAALGEVLLRHPHVMVASDDMYEHILWTHKPFVNILNACPQLRERTIIINGVSKAYAMTGWRIGYAAANKTLVAAMRKVQSQSTSNPCSIAQKAAVAALDEDQSCVASMVTHFKERHDFVYQTLSEMGDIACHPSHGTFYIFPDMSNVINQLNSINNDLELAEHLLNKAGVAVVPGSAFGAPGCLRLSFAVSMETLNDALNRMKTVLQRG